MFAGCYSLEFINLTSFNTSRVRIMASMFENCFSLKSLYLTNFNTSLAIYMEWMFYNCNSLKSLDLAHLKISSVIDMMYMFGFCYNLEYINLENAIENNNLNYTKMFELIPENIVYCINETNSPKIYSQLKNKTCSINYCLNDWKKNKK